MVFWVRDFRLELHGHLREVRLLVFFSGSPSFYTRIPSVSPETCQFFRPPRRAFSPGLRRRLGVSNPRRRVLSMGPGACVSSPGSADGTLNTTPSGTGPLRVRTDVCGNRRTVRRNVHKFRLGGRRGPSRQRQRSGQFAPKSKSDPWGDDYRQLGFLPRGETSDRIDLDPIPLFPHLAPCNKNRRSSASKIFTV